MNAEECIKGRIGNQSDTSILFDIVDYIDDKQTQLANWIDRNKAKKEAPVTKDNVGESQNCSLTMVKILRK